MKRSTDTVIATDTDNQSQPHKLLKISSTTSTTIPRISRPLSDPNELKIALTHLTNSDPLLSTLITHHEPPNFTPFQPPFIALSKSIIYQQVSYKTATCIYSRFISLCGGEEESVIPLKVLNLTQQQLRQIGVSLRKISYLHDLAKKFHNGVLSDNGILNMDDKSLFRMLTMVNGIGSWSVHMFMIFSLHRPDVLPVNDLQVRKGVQMLYGLDDLPRPSQMEVLCHKWRPYRSVGAWYMWRLVQHNGLHNSNNNNNNNASVSGSGPGTGSGSGSVQRLQHCPTQFVESNYAHLNRM